MGDRLKLRAVQKGLLSTGFPKSAVQIVADSDDAADLIEEWSGEGDTVLYEGRLDA